MTTTLIALLATGNLVQGLLLWRYKSSSVTALQTTVKVLTDQLNHKRDYIHELEAKVVSSASSAELHKLLNELFEDPTHDGDPQPDKPVPGKGSN